MRWIYDIPVHWNISQTKIKSKLSRTRQKKTGKQTYTDYVVLAIWAIGGQNFGRPVIKMVANATGRVLILLPAITVIFSLEINGEDLFV